MAAHSQITPSQTTSPQTICPQVASEEPSAGSKKSALHQELLQLLDKAHACIEHNQFADAFRLLGLPLSELRDNALAPGTWPQFISAVRSHPIFTHLQKDPYTRRAYEKPRGFAGDAVMLDYVYGELRPDMDAVGAGVFGQTTGGPMGLSVKYRRELLNGYLQDCADNHGGARVLSIASGHCREAADSPFASPDATARGLELVALDQDAAACAVVAQTYGGSGITVANKSIRRLLSNSDQWGEFHLIYAAGLYDYLSAPLARRLTARIWSMLAPGGTVLIGNFSNRSQGRGYLDSVMDWTLTYRSEDEVRGLFPAEANLRLFQDPYANVIYAEARRPAR